MLSVLVNDILPVFAMLAVGWLLGRAQKVSREEAMAVNRVAFLVLQPALILPLIAGLDVPAFDLTALGLYAACQAGMFAATFALLRLAFRRDTLEAWLLAMAVVFVNTLLYIWPISILIYGAAGALPVTALVAWDTAVTFAFFIITTDVLATRSGALPALKRLARNPVLLAIGIGAVVNLVGATLPEPLLTGFSFAGAAAAPLTLFALGVILSAQSLRLTPVIATVSGLKLLAFPALVFAVLSLTGREETWTALVTLAAAGPSGAMAFALALLYGVRTQAIAPVIIWTSTLSLITLAMLA